MCERESVCPGIFTIIRMLWCVWNCITGRFLMIVDIFALCVSQHSDIVIYCSVYLISLICSRHFTAPISMISCTLFIHGEFKFKLKQDNNCGKTTMKRCTRRSEYTYIYSSAMYIYNIVLNKYGQTPQYRTLTYTTI